VRGGTAANAPPPLGLVALLGVGAAGMIAGLAFAMRLDRASNRFRFAQAVVAAGFAAYVLAMLLR
jgi:hypothetical protein